MESSMTFDGNAKGTETAKQFGFDHVDMRYAGAGADSLTDITFTAKKGQTIGIIGVREVVNLAGTIDSAIFMMRRRECLFER